MTKLTAAILDSNIPLIRTILVNEPEQIDQRSATGDLPISLAKKKGMKKIEALFVRATNWEHTYTMDELRKLLVDLIAEVSEDTYCASWLSDIELQIWHLINKTADPSLIELWQRRGDWPVLEDIRYLKDITNTWAIWDDVIGDSRPITLEDWYKKLNEYR